MKQIVWLGPEIVDDIKRLFDQRKYADAYDVIINNTDWDQFDGKKWFIAAAGVNRNEGYASSFIKTYTLIANKIQTEGKKNISDLQIKKASNKIAKHILTHVINNKGLVPSFDQLQKIDYEISTTELQLQTLQWAGTPFGIFPGCEGPVPDKLSDWSLVLIATEYAIVSSLYEGSTTYIKSFFDHAFNNAYLKEGKKMKTKHHFKMLYDGDCPICRAEVSWLTKCNKDGYLEFEDISKTDNSDDQRSYGKSKQELLDRIHGVTEEGELISGVEVFRHSYNSVGLGWMMAPSKWPLFEPISDWGYTLFAKHRVRLGRLIDKVIARFV